MKYSYSEQLAVHYTNLTLLIPPVHCHAITDLLFHLVHHNLLKLLLQCTLLVTSSSDDFKCWNILSKLQALLQLWLIDMVSSCSRGNKRKWYRLLESYTIWSFWNLTYVASRCIYKCWHFLTSLTKFLTWWCHPLEQVTEHTYSHNL